MLTLLIKTENDSLKNMYKKDIKNFDTDSGFDMYCPNNLIINSGSYGTIINQEISCQMIDEEGKSKPYMVFPRSSMGTKTPLRLSNSIGLIDKDYRGTIGLIVDNISKENFEIEKGMRLGQIVAFNGEPFNVKFVNSLEDTERGTGGYGSTGR